MTTNSQEFHDSPQVSSYRSWIWDLSILTLLFACLYFLGLGSYPLFTPDEGRYSEVAREMLVTHDFITPRLNGVVFLDKPIMYYWLQASAMKVFGINEWALRFWPALIGIWGCLSMYIGGRLLFTRRAGLLSALLLGTSVLYFGAAHYANLDLEVAVLVSSTLLFFLLGIKKEKRLFIYTAYFFAGLAVLTKGLIGIAFPMLIVGSWVLALRRFSVLKKLALFTGPLLTFAIVLPWYILAQQANHEFFHFFFVVQQLSRFLSTTDFNNQVAWWFYFPIVLAGFLPWTFFLLGMLGKNLSELRQGLAKQDSKLYLMLWAFLIFLFFSIPHSKTIGYILPVFPALALLMGQYVDRLWTASVLSKGQRFLSLMIVLSFGCFTALCFLAPSIKALEASTALTPYLYSAGALCLITTLVLAFFALRTNVAALCSSLFITAIIFFGLLVSSASIINENSTKPLALHLKVNLEPQDEVVTYFKYFQDLPLYLGKRITIVADWEDPGIANNDNWLRELWYGKSFQDTKEWLISENTFWKRWNSSKRLYVLTQLKYYKQFKERAKERFYLVSQYKETVLMTNIPL